MSLTLTAMSDSTVTSRQQQWSEPSRGGPYISVITNRSTNLLIRGFMLFSVGVFLALVLNLLQVQRNVTLFPPDVISSIFSSTWWVPLCCGIASGEHLHRRWCAPGTTPALLKCCPMGVKPWIEKLPRGLSTKHNSLSSSPSTPLSLPLHSVSRRIHCFLFIAMIGLLYPCIDRLLGEPHQFKREWSSVMRCVAVFVGINHASAKVDFANNIQLSLTVAALSIGLWWTFDRSRSGFGLGVSISLLATLATQLLVYNEVFQYTSPDFLYIRSWLPCIFFAGVITMGNIGRQLALYEYKFIQEKSHQD
uniref:Insulin-induced gene protein n=1 Tax=Scophthalmus maximus TaxID=52904 RepID=A0A8D3DIC1_SCOMX